MMYRETIDYYNNNTREFIERTIHADISNCQQRFLKLVKRGARILDAGCGSGRDSKFFLEQGMNVQAIDASEKMCQAASKYIGQPVACMRPLNMVQQRRDVWVVFSVIIGWMSWNRFFSMIPCMSWWKNLRQRMCGRIIRISHGLTLLWGRSKKTEKGRL